MQLSQTASEECELVSPRSLKRFTLNRYTCTALTEWILLRCYCSNTSQTPKTTWFHTTVHVNECGGERTTILGPLTVNDYNYLFALLALKLRKYLFNCVPSLIQSISKTRNLWKHIKASEKYPDRRVSYPYNAQYNIFSVQTVVYGHLGRDNLLCSDLDYPSVRQCRMESVPLAFQTSAHPGPTNPHSSLKHGYTFYSWITSRDCSPQWYILIWNRNMSW